MWRNRFLGGVSSFVTYAPDDGSGGGAPAPAPAPAPGASPAPSPAPAPAPATPAPGPTGSDAGGPTRGADGRFVAATPAPTPALATGAVTDPTKQVTSPADWPADWREKAAGKDTGFLNQLKRYTDPVAALNWVRTKSLQVDAGELRPTLKADATPEELAEFRKAHGVPDKAEGYVAAMKLPDGLVTGEADKPLLDSFAATALAKNIPQDTFNTMVGWFFEQQGQAMAARHAADQEARVANEVSLRQSMGADFLPNMNALKAFWRDQPPELIDTILGARDSKGRVLGNIPEVTSWIAGIARQLDPAATLLPTGGEGGSKGIAARKAEIEGQMYLEGRPNPAYFGGPMEKEYRDLLVAEERMRQRAA